VASVSAVLAGFVVVGYAFMIPPIATKHLALR
jgi:hypothetical protein